MQDEIAVGPAGGEPRWTEWTEAITQAYQDNVELGYRRPLAALLHRGQVAAVAYASRVSGARVRAIPEVHAGHG